ncbi:hypothetical protein F5Y10DRAFT_289621 [Nemania abortiva]|nr:hypothetical protein F5Y10DRAFT_289621 [Nemania abortiva]
MDGQYSSITFSPSSTPSNPHGVQHTGHFSPPYSEAEYYEGVAHRTLSLDSLISVSQHCNDESSSEECNPMEKKNIYGSALRRIGKLRSATLLLSVVFSIASLSYLGWLWNGTPDDPTNAWAKVVRNQWVTRSATVAAVVLRVASSAQAAVTTSMLAAFLLETRGVRLQDAAEFSILRFSNSGPLMNLQTFFQNSRALAGLVVLILVLLLALITTTLQFTSTILLTDLRGRFVLGPSESDSYLSGVKWNSAAPLYVNYWTVTPTTTAHFIEYSKPVNSPDYVADTGFSVRGFLPISNETARSQLRSYRGMAALFDTRVVCSRPSIDFTKFGVNVSSKYTPIQLEGRMRSSLTLPEFSHDTSNLVIDFDCSSSQTTKAPQFYLCQLRPEQSQGLTSRLQPPPNEDSGMPPHFGQVYLLWDIPAACTTFSNKTCSTSQTNPPAAQDGPWQTFTVTNSSQGAEVLRVSVCYDALAPSLAHDYNVSFSFSTQLPSEPGFVYANDTTNLVNDSAVRRQLGATSDADTLSAVDRGVISFDMKEVDEQISATRREDPYSLTYSSPTMPFLWYNVWAPVRNSEDGSLKLAFDNTTTPLGTGANPILRSIFFNVLVDTRNPALAIQAMLTTILRCAYYDALPFFDYDQVAVTRMVNLEQIPLAHSGFTVIVALVVAHCLLTLAILVLFILRGRMVVLHKAWAVIMDMWTEEGYTFLGDDGTGAEISIEDDVQGSESDRIARLRSVGS